MLRFSIDDTDGTLARQFLDGGPWEVWVLGHKCDVDGNLDADADVLAWPIGANTEARALAIAELLRPELEHLNRALQHAALLGELPAAGRDDGHKHKLTLARFSRELPIKTVCVRCNTSFHEFSPAEMDELTRRAADVGYGDLRTYLTDEANGDLPEQAKSLMEGEPGG